MRKLIFLIMVITLIWALSLDEAEAKREMPERWYADHWCQERGGQTEVKNPDDTRTDCKTLGYAIEVDFADKWYEAVGQALHYAEQHELLPGIVLIIETPSQCKKMHAAAVAIYRTSWTHLEYGQVRIKLWVIGKHHCGTTA